MDPEISLGSDRGDRGRLDLIPRRRSESDASPLAPRLDGASNRITAGALPTSVFARGAEAGIGLLVNAALLATLAVLVEWRDPPKVEDEAPYVEIVDRVPDQPPHAAPQAARPDPPGTVSGDAPPTKAPESPPAAPRPALVAAPPEPKADKEGGKPPTGLSDPAVDNRPQGSPTDTTTPEAPRVLSAPEGHFAVPTAAEPPAKAVPVKPARQASRPDPQAQLEMALPMDTSAYPASFQAVLSGRGSATSNAYRGLVFARLGRSTMAIEKAKAAHLEGLVIAAFTLDDTGALIDLHVAQSSSRPAVDQAALDMIREAAPFPPPPPGAERTFSPALMIGGS